MAKETVVLVDEKDNIIGLMEKLAAHKHGGHLHRAVSILLYRTRNGQREVLLQQRSKIKPLWPLFWSNTVCTHPRDGESYKDCAVRRLREEMGIAVIASQLEFLFKLLYRAKYNDVLAEYELDSVFFGVWDGVPTVNHKEAQNYIWMDWKDVKQDMSSGPQRYTPWFQKLVHDPRVERVFL